MTRLTDTHDDDLEKADYSIHDVYAQWLPLENDAINLISSQLIG